MSRGFAVGLGILCLGAIAACAHRRAAERRLGLDPPARPRIAVGGDHRCARFAGKGWACWGQNSHQQLGVASVDASATAIPVPAGVRDAVELAAGDFFTCALLGDGTVRCWGNEHLGSADHPEPLAVFGLSNVIQLSAYGGQACALIEDGTVRCWGTAPIERWGEDPDRAPAPIAHVEGATQISVGRIGCALLRGASIRCWSSPLGPGAPDGVRGARAMLRFGAFYGCVQVETGGVRCFGDAAGDVRGLPPVSDLSVGSTQACAIAEGRLYCWGVDLQARRVEGLEGLTELVDGPAGPCVRQQDDRIRCWNNLGPRDRPAAFVE